MYETWRNQTWRIVLFGFNFQFCAIEDHVDHVVCLSRVLAVLMKQQLVRLMKQSNELHCTAI